MRTLPFVANWQAGPVGKDGFSAWLRLDDERLFAGHYPGTPLLPGSYLVEALVQAAGGFLGDGMQLKEIVACRFHAPLLPRDTAAVRFALGEPKPGGTLVEATVRGRSLAAEVTLLLGATLEPPPAPAIGAGAAAGHERRLDGEFVRQTLPHRPPALLVDEGHCRQSAAGRPLLVGHKLVTTTEPCYDDGEAAGGYPASLVLESFCQACGLLRAAAAKAGDGRGEPTAPVVAKLAGVRVHGEAWPGERIDHHVELVVRAPEGAVFTGESRVGERVILVVSRVIASEAALASLRPAR
jgi:3-hydroxymyristoyl/3-hydroxydecanoyl-(acyl carrier protein) dehydratase